MGVYDFTIYDFISRNAQLFPDRDCIVFNGVRLSHKQYKEKCDQLAAGLLRLSISKGDRLGIVARNCDEFAVLYGAAAKIGAIVLPVNWRFKQDEMEYVLSDGTPRVVFAGQDYRKMVAEAVGKVKSVERCYTIGGGEVPEAPWPASSGRRPVSRGTRSRRGRPRNTKSAIPATSGGRADAREFPSPRKRVRIAPRFRDRGEVLEWSIRNAC